MVEGSDESQLGTSSSNSSLGKTRIDKKHCKQTILDSLTKRVENLDTNISYISHYSNPEESQTVGFSDISTAAFNIKDGIVSTPVAVSIFVGLS